MVVTPESFSDLPEYAASGPSRRGSLQSSASSTLRHDTGHADPHFVVLSRFEDVSLTNAGSFPMPDRRPSIPDTFQHLSITTSPQTGAALLTTSNPRIISADEPLIRHFRQNILPCLLQPQEQDSVPEAHLSRDVLEVEAARFAPVSVPMPRLPILTDILPASPCHLRCQCTEPSIWRTGVPRGCHAALSPGPFYGGDSDDAR